ncbi:MAG: holo-ACP synthase [Cyanobacteria bacterium NC_groundwater_1444_Ag_S-0.65um_54_12]|nr:holo-ACP synthase [Cyanobacteria bacterium NC_groundwater_1444_Ag_S-0.65um_54_12]
MIHGIGVDLVKIPRIRRLLERYGVTFLQRVYTATERSYSLSQHDPASSLAARFAAKEAALKALGTGWVPGMSWQDFEVQRQAKGAPLLLLHGIAKETACHAKITNAHLTISHELDLAIAYVILERCATNGSSDEDSADAAF